MAESLAAMQETWDLLVRKIPWRREWLATHSSILARRVPRTEKPGGLQSMGSQTVELTERLSLSFFFVFTV